MSSRWHLLLSCVLVAGAACGSGAPRSPPMPEPVLGLGCGDSVFDRDEQGRQKLLLDPVRRELDVAFRLAQQSGSQAARAMFVDPIEMLARRLESPKAGEHLAITLCGECPRGVYPFAGGWVGTLAIFVQDDRVAESPAQRDRGACIMSNPWMTVNDAWVVKTAEGWRIHSSPPASALSTVKPLSTHAELWVSQRRRWVHTDVDLEVETSGNSVVLDMPRLERLDGVWTGPPMPGYRLTSLRVDGKPLEQFDFVVSDDRLVVPAHPGRVRVQLRYEGVPPYHEGTTQQRNAQLQISDWIPAPPLPAFHAMEVTIHVPEDEVLVASMPVTASPAQAGWITYRGGARRDRQPILLILPRMYYIEGNVVVARHTRVTPISMMCDDKGGLLVPVLDALTEIAPIEPQRIAGIDTFRHFLGQSGDNLILVDSLYENAICGGEGDGGGAAKALLAHELAHVWFGEHVRTAGGFAAGWWESLAEYVATSLWDDVGPAQRHKRSDEYAALPASEELVAMSQPMDVAYYEQLSYGRGALLLTALEDRIGKPRMLELLRDFIASNTGKLGSWDALLASVEKVAGHDDAIWLRTWLGRPGAPELRLVDGVVSAGRLHARLRQSGDVPFTGAVDVAFMKGDDALVHHRIAFDAADTAINLPVPPGAETLLLDPDYRLPRKYDPRGSAAANGLVLRLVP